MIREDEVRNIVGNMREPFLHRPLGELDAIKEVKVKRSAVPVFANAIFTLTCRFSGLTFTSLMASNSPSGL